MKKMFKRAALIICALTLVLSGLGAFAEDYDYQYVYDEAGVLDESTEKYIDGNMHILKELCSAGEIEFKTISADKAPENGVDSWLVKVDYESDNYAMVWVDGADVIRLYDDDKNPAISGRMKYLQRQIDKHNAGISDKQQKIKDAFSIYTAGLAYSKGRDISDKGLMVGSVNAAEYVKPLMEKYDRRGNIIGTLLGVAVLAGIIFLFNKKSPEGTVPGDGSNFKGGIAASGTLPVTGIPGSAGYTSGMGGPTAVPK